MIKINKDSKDKEHFMRAAIEIARKSAEPLPCGTVIVKGNKIIAQQHNKQRLIPDVTAHAEILSLREACANLKSKNLKGCTVYCTCEPCLMCLSAMIWAKVDKLYFAVPLLKANKGSSNNFSLAINDFLATSPHTLLYESGVLQEVAMELLYN